MTTNDRFRDMGLSRRELLQLGAGGLGLGLLGGVGPVPPVLAQASRAVAANPTGKILVVFEWFGGNDGLNTVVPYGDANYYRHRPTIGLASSAASTAPIATMTAASRCPSSPTPASVTTTTSRTSCRNLKSRTRSELA